MASEKTKQTFSQRRTLIICFTITYALVLYGTFYADKISSKHLREKNGLVASFFGDGYTVRRMDVQQAKQQKKTLFRHLGALDTKVTTMMEEEMTTQLLAINDTIVPRGELTNGSTITDILRREIKLPALDEQTSPPLRLRFLPGTLNMEREETLRHCYADPTIYTKHFPQSEKQVTSISDNLQLIFIMIPKSGSSTGRWIMDNVLDASDHPMSALGKELTKGEKYANYTVLTFVRDPLNRFYSSYDEAYLRYGPWMKKRTGKAFRYLKTFKHPYPYLYDNMTDFVDFQNAFCPESLGMKKWECLDSRTHENGTLAARFEKFVWDYDGTPFDLVSTSVCTSSLT